MSPAEIEVDVGIGRPCHRCDGALVLLARIPHRLTGADGSHVDGTRDVGLCAGCDRHDRDAQGLLAFFAVHETVTDATVESIAALIDEWLGRVVDRQASRDREVREEIDRYFGGGSWSPWRRDGG